MVWRPDRTVKKPMYKQIAEYIENGIGDGTFPLDKPLPSERNLAHLYGVNRSTIVSAYAELEARGVVERKKGSGTIISRDIWGLAKKRIPSWNKYIEAGTFLPNLPVMQRIRKETEESQLINLASGELSADLFPDDFIRKTLLTKEFKGHLGYDHPQGHSDLRQTLVKHVKDFRNIITKPESILMTSGAQQAIHLVIECLLKPGDAVVIENPSYNYSLPIFKTAGLKVYSLEVGEKGIRPQDLIELHKKHQIKMLFLNPIFQNPTGTLLPYSQRKEILNISSQYGIPVIEDDPYSLLPFTEDRVSTLKSMDMNGNVLYISSLSKIAAPGLRIGWIIGPPSVIERLADAKQQFDFGHSALSQWIGNQFLSSPYFEEHLEHLKVALKRRRDTMIRCLNEHFHDQIEFYSPLGGIHMWCRFKEDIDENRLLEQAIAEGMIFAPGSTLGTEKGCIRLTYARGNEEVIRHGIQRLFNAYEKVKE
ncbi:DNA-binding transcriptional MocR family regulator [Pullulanibacillus pueri]|uniref:Transcriptional regulator n=1 Tax=Pullulanibacillus pueri TaxID=1437324 RepID=A0A8J2ZX45_9BACL|nr:PLP-dependent aminotransferase family protein [Pullulanibacillus pueri]MBM7682845.1 DNA-binding transcriptional MocR family regulator [Pullulanibacillus pueri]GGH84272.1 transcriptional regulator [Pullulanibacillus pueri]